MLQHHKLEYLAETRLVMLLQNNVNQGFTICNRFILHYCLYFHLASSLLRESYFVETLFHSLYVIWCFLYLDDYLFVKLPRGRISFIFIYTTKLWGFTYTFVQGKRRLSDWLYTSSTNHWSGQEQWQKVFAVSYNCLSTLNWISAN